MDRPDCPECADCDCWEPGELEPVDAGCDVNPVTNWETGGFALDDGSGYDLSDPKHPRHPDVFSSAWDMREGK